LLRPDGLEDILAALEANDGLVHETSGEVYSDPFGKHTEAKDLRTPVETRGLRKLGDVLLCTVSKGLPLIGCDSYIFG
jgi:hypothetical protein